MAKQKPEFDVYECGVALRTQIYCRVLFRETAGALFRVQPACHSQIANCNEFVKRLGRGESLSAGAFRQEGPGYAFRSGRVRFYGVYSDVFKGCFVLSHAILKDQQKLAAADVNTMEQTKKLFDALKSLPTRD